MTIGYIALSVISGAIGVLCGFGYPFLMKRLFRENGIVPGIFTSALIVLAGVVGVGINHFFHTSAGLWLVGLYLPVSLIAKVVFEVLGERRKY